MKSDNPLDWIHNYARPEKAADAIEAGRVRRGLAFALARAAGELARLSTESTTPRTQLLYATEARRYSEASQFLMEVR